MSKNILLSKNLKAMSLIGMWPPLNTKYKIIYHIYSKFIFMWFVVFTLSMLYEIRFIYFDFEEVTTNLGVSLLYFVGIIKVYTVMYKHKQFQFLVNFINKTELDIMSSADKTAKNILKSYVLQNNGVRGKFWMLTFGTILSFFISPSIHFLLLSTQTKERLTVNETFENFKKPLVFSSWFPFDKYDNKYYLFAYTLQTISGIFGASYLGIWDTFIAALMIFSIGQFKILQHFFSNIYPFKNKILSDHLEKEIEKNFVIYVKYHIMLTKYIQDLNKLISPVMFLDFFVCSFMLCAIGLQAILEGPSIQFAFTIEYLLAMLIQLFLFYWHANEIMLESQNIYKAIWNSYWYNCNTKIQKGLCLVMMRAQKASLLNAGPMYRMSLETFILILRASYSYVAVLRQMYMPEAEEI